MIEMLTHEQIENWRKILTVQYGAVALLMTVEQIQQLRDNMQKQFSTLDENNE